MSEKEKKNAPQEEQPQANTTPETEQAAEETVEEETFTVTREQMEQMEQLAKMVSDASDKYLRLAAEYDNYRKRTTKEKENVYADAKADTVKEFLGVLDNLERGLAQFDEGDPHRQFIADGGGADLAGHLLGNGLGAHRLRRGHIAVHHDL